MSHAEPNRQESQQPPTTEEMGWQLVAQRWSQKSKHIWVSPEGRYFVGVRDAWLEMKRQEASGF